jgi:chromosome partitioning protein
MKVWAIANQKGGVGKTTTAVSLSGLLAQNGYTVLMIDMDPHGSLTSYFGYNPDTVEGSVYKLFYADKLHEIRSLVSETGVERLYLIPANPALATLDRQLGVRNSIGLVIARSLGLLTPSYDYVLIDCPPMLGILMVNALAACHHLIVPVQAEHLALKGLERMVRTLDMMSRSRNVSIPYTVVPTMYDRRTRESGTSLERLRETYSDHLWPEVIPVDTKFREASRARLPIAHLFPRARGAQAYAMLLGSLLHSDQRVESLVVA